MFSQSTSNILSLRIARLPQGPTLTFRLESYTTSGQVRAAQRRPEDVSRAHMAPPLLVLQGFGSASSAGINSSGVAHGDAMKLVQTTFQAMFPPINPATLRLKDCKRVLLVHHEKSTGLIILRHFILRSRAIGVSKKVGALTMGAFGGGASSAGPHFAGVPNLRAVEDIAEYISGGGGGAVSDESEWEVDGDVANCVELPGRGGSINLGKNGGDSYGKISTAASVPTTTKSAIRLKEVGPRLSLRLVKSEVGLCEGEVVHHAFVEKTPEERALLADRAREKVAAKEARKKQQAANVQEKLAKKEEKKSAKAEKIKARQEKSRVAAASGTLGGDVEVEEEEGNLGGEMEEEADNETDAGEEETDLADDEDEAGSDNSEGTDPGQQTGHAIYSRPPSKRSRERPENQQLKKVGFNVKAVEKKKKNFGRGGGSRK